MKDLKHWRFIVRPDIILVKVRQTPLGYLSVINSRLQRSLFVFENVNTALLLRYWIYLMRRTKRNRLQLIEHNRHYQEKRTCLVTFYTTSSVQFLCCSLFIHKWGNMKRRLLIEARMRHLQILYKFDFDSCESSKKGTMVQIHLAHVEWVSIWILAAEILRTWYAQPAQ